MAVRHTSLLLNETDTGNNQSNIKYKKVLILISIITFYTNLFQILSDFTNNQLENVQTSSGSPSVTNRSLPVHHHRRRREHHSLTLSTVRRYKNGINRRNQSIDNCPDNDRIKIEFEPLQDIESFQQGKLHLQTQDEQFKNQQAKLQRSIYNSKQTPLIPFIIGSYSPSLSSEQNHLLFNIRALINNIVEEYTFFEQFKIQVTNKEIVCIQFYFNYK